MDACLSRSLPEEVDQADRSLPKEVDQADWCPNADTTFLQAPAEDTPPGAVFETRSETRYDWTRATPRMRVCLSEGALGCMSPTEFLCDFYGGLGGVVERVCEKRPGVTSYRVVVPALKATLGVTVTAFGDGTLRASAVPQENDRTVIPPLFYGLFDKVAPTCVPHMFRGRCADLLESALRKLDEQRTELAERIQGLSLRCRECEAHNEVSSAYVAALTNLLRALTQRARSSPGDCPNVQWSEELAKVRSALEKAETLAGTDDLFAGL